MTLPGLKHLINEKVLNHKALLSIGILPIIIAASLVVFSISSQAKLNNLSKENQDIAKKFELTKKELYALKNQDQVLTNKKNTEEIKKIHDSYKHTVSSYEQLLDLKIVSKKTDELDKLFALSLKQLADKDYITAEKTLTDLNQKIKTEKDKFVVAAVPQSGPSGNITSSNTAPSSGYTTQKVSSDIGDFTVSLVAADLSSTRVIVDTASDSDCRDNCPVLSLADYVSRSGGYAGVNGSYFCPAAYPTCAGKTNSFDLLVMNKNKHYFNSDNNAYSTNPAVIFQNGSVRFVGQALDWGRDTGVDGVLSNFPLLLSGGNITFNGDGDPKKGSKGSRPFVGNKGNTVYIGIVYSATVAEGAHALKALGLDNAMNLDSGGSTALWSGGYKAGPGRNIPNAIVFVRK